MRRVRIVAWMIALAVAALPLRPPAAAPRCYPTDRFVVLTGGMVKDALTSLIWQQDGSWTRTGRSSSENCTWAEAQPYCSELTLGGYSDWRLPTVKELRSIVDFTVYDPAINRTAFPNTPGERFWTSSPFAGSSDYAWNVDFSDGFLDVNHAGSYFRVRCVR